MKYAAKLTVPSLTVESAPVSVEIAIPENFLLGYEIFFPPGCAGLCGIRIFINAIQVAPARGSADLWFRGEGSITWVGRYRMGGGSPAGARVVIEGYNDDDTYPHTPLIRLDGGAE